MSPLATDTHCPPRGPCPPLPPAFVRLRYFFGKRLGVADLTDEQLYHASKMRFHNMHLHGAGILCGLEPSVFDGTTIRVSAGAALDSCGHEIVVPYDQCIDVDAWYRRELAERRDQPGNETWPAAIVGDADPPVLELCIVARFVECATAPEPAPRDPCACDEAGVENGRVKESYELRLMLRADVDALPKPGAFPADEDVAAALASDDRCGALERAVRSGCPMPEVGEWLVLGCVDATLTADLDAVETVDVTVEGTGSLLSTALLQRIVCRLADASSDAALRDGPRVVSATLAEDATTITLHLSGPVTNGTAADAFTLHAFDGDVWTEADVTTAAVDDADGPRIVVTVADPGAVFATGGRYRLARVDDDAAPIVDADMRPLHPTRYAWQFRATEDGGTWAAEDL